MPPEPSHDAALVLLVDDTESAREVAERRLRRAGYRVISVANRGAALEVLIRHPVATVIADFELGRGLPSGLDLLEQVGKRRKECGRVLWCADPHWCNLAAERGISCVPKGSEYTELLAALERELGGPPRGAA